MYQPQGGALYLDNIDMRQLNVMDLRRSIAYVPQDTKCFMALLPKYAPCQWFGNGCWPAKRSKKAGILEDILTLPDGFNTRLTDNASNKYPPGFLRSLSIARAFVSPTDIVLFDEPGASLDFASDTLFMQQLTALKGQCTMIMVSHRPSHIRLADKVILMQQGSVQFAGDPEQAISLLMETVAWQINKQQQQQVKTKPL